MSAIVVVVVYAGVGLCGALLVYRRGRRTDPAGAAGAAALCLLLWPFILPVSLGAEPRASAGRGTCCDRIDRVARRVSAAMQRARQAGVEEPRACQVVEAFVARLQASDLRLVELRAVTDEAHASTRDRLEALRGAGAEELERGLALLEELAGKLTLLSFADLSAGGAPGGDQEMVEELLLRIEALTEVSNVALDATSPSPAAR